MAFVCLRYRLRSYSSPAVIQHLRHYASDGCGLVVRYLVEQLPGANECSRYTFKYHLRDPDVRRPVLNWSGAARTEPFAGRSGEDPLKKFSQVQSDFFCYATKSPLGVSSLRSKIFSQVLCTV